MVPPAVPLPDRADAPLDEGAFFEAAGGIRFSIAAAGDGILRLRVAAGTRSEMEWGGRLELPGGNRHVPQLVQQEARGLYRFSGLRVTVDPATLRLTICDSGGRIAFDTTDDWLAVGRGRTRLRVDYERDERIHGLGQGAMERLDLRDMERRMWHEVRSARFPCATGIPFMLSTRGYGLLLNTSYPSRFVIGDARLAPPPVLPKQALLAPAPWPLDQPSGEEHAQRITVIADCEFLEFFLIIGAAAKEILGRYAALVGPCALLPNWALGYIQSRNRYRNQAELLGVAREFRRRHIPCDVVVIDWYWFPEFGDFDWNPENWPDVAALMAELRALGFRLMIALHPYIDRASRNWEAFSAAGIMVEYPPTTRALTSHDAILDLTHPGAASLLHAVVARLSGQGCDAWWIDQVQPEVHPVGSLHRGGSRERVHNVYPLLFTQALYDGQRACSDTRVFTLAFAAYLGAPRFGAVLWTGDIDPTWEVFAEQVVIGQQLGLSGMHYWTTDMGGYVHYAHYDPELYIRWFQWGVFCPLFRSHTKRPESEPWSFGEDIERGVTTAIRLRYALLPYLAQLMWEARLKGLPLVRPLFLEYPDEPGCIGQDHEFLLGDNILVAPVLAAGARVRSVYLPPGIWYDGWTGEAHVGARTFDVFAPLSRVPFFLRAGALLPFDESAGEHAHDASGTYTVRIFPGPPAETVLRFDDGLTYAYERGDVGEVLISHDGRLDRICIVARGDGKAPFPSTLELSLQDQACSREAQFVRLGAGDAAGSSAAAYAPDARAMKLRISGLRSGDRYEVQLRNEPAT